jgi:hypothetical protein
MAMVKNFLRIIRKNRLASMFLGQQGGFDVYRDSAKSEDE